MATVKTETKKVTEVTLKLSEEEAEALAAILQETVSHYDGKGELAQEISLALSNEGYEGSEYFLELEDETKVFVLRCDDTDEDDCEACDSEDDEEEHEDVTW